MNDILALAIAAHGGQRHWDAMRTVTVELLIGGALWDLKGKSGILENAHYEADLHVQRATLEGARGASVYAASKHAVEGMTKSAALEVAGRFDQD
jgi:NAD(P)-dependent dehydrogenase (short-subunit alcohol dehydrogenase family)